MTAPEPETDELPDLSWRDRLALWWLACRRRWRRCPECSRRGYGSDGPGPGRAYRWVDDPIVQRLGFETYPYRCNTCGQTLGGDRG